MSFKQTLPSSLLNLCQKFKLSHTQATLLDRGLSFAVTEQSTKFKHTLQSSLEKSSNALQWSWLYNQVDKPDFQQNSLNQQLRKTNKNSKPPPPPQIIPNEILTIPNLLQKTTRWLGQTNQTKGNPSNVNPQQMQALQTLKKLSHQIIIKKSDKGSTTVLLDRVSYVTEAERQLNKSLHYTPIQHIQLDISINKTIQVINNLFGSGLISKQQRSLLLPPQNPSPRKFYLLPKIHKDITDWPNTYQPPGRTILTNVDTESSQISRFLDHFLQPYVRKIPTYIRDSIDFINRLRQTHVPKNAILATMDVTNLYTNLPHHLIRETIRGLFAINPLPIHTHLLEILDIILDFNEFSFNSHSYKQICGVAMGNSASPSLANLTFAEIEQKVMQASTHKPLLMVRYLDDIMIIWPHDLESLQRFTNLFNTQVPSISLTMTAHLDHATFLDVEVSKDSGWQQTGLLDTRVHFKPQNCLALIHGLSAHQPHTFRGIVRSQFIRYARICSHPAYFNMAANKLCKALALRNYDLIGLLIPLKLEIHKLMFTTKQDAGPCNSRTCSLCPLWDTIPTSILRFEQTSISRKCDCNSQQVIYIIWCSSCPQAFYVGQTSHLRHRILNHLSDIRRGLPTSVAAHFNLKHHPSPSQSLKINILETLIVTRGMKWPSINLALTRIERKWIRRLNANDIGLNSDPNMDYVISFTGPHSKATQTLHNKFKELTYSILGPPQQTKPFHRKYQGCPRIIYAPTINNKISNFLVRSYLPPLD